MRDFWRISIQSSNGRNFDIFNRSFARRWITFQSWQHRVQGSCSKCESWGWWWCEMQSFSWENAILLANGKNAVILYYTKVYRSAVLRFRENQFSIQVFPTLKIRNCCCYYYCRYPRVTNLIYFEFQGNFSAKKDTFQETDVLL